MHRFWLVPACSLLFSACATVATNGGGSGASSGGQPLGVEQPVIGEPGLASSQASDTIYDLLLIEIASQRGENNTATETALRVAKRTRDARMAARATRSALSDRNFDSALESAKVWVELEGDEGSAAREALSIIYLTREETDEAMEVFKGLIETAGDNETESSRTYRRIADLLSRQKDPSKAPEMMSELVELQPENAQAWFAKSWVCDRVNNNEDGLAAADKALELKPDWEEAAVMKAGFLLKLEQKDEFEKYSNGFLERNETAGRFRLQFARALVDSNKPEPAMVQFEKILESQPNNLDALFAAGVLSIQLERYKDAAEHFEKHLDTRNGDNDQVRLYLGTSYNRLEQYEDATRTLLEVNQEAYYFESRRLLATVKAKTETPDAAVLHLDTLTPADDEDKVQLYLTKEQIYRDAKRPDDALAVLSEALSALPANSDLLYARGLVAAQLKKTAIYEADFRQLIEIEPENAHAYNALGYSLADHTDRFDEALELIEKALVLRPEDPFIVDSMGWVQYRMGNLELARDYLQQALETRPDAEIAAHLGEVLWKLGETERAKTIWSDAKKRDPENTVLRETIDAFTQ